MKAFRRTFLRAAAAALAAVCIAAVSVAENPKGERYDPPKPAKPIPAVAVFGMKPTKDPLLALRGRVVLVTLGSTYYERVGDALPDMNAMYDRLGPKGLTILQVFLDEEPPKVEAWLRTNSVRWPASVTDTETKEKIVEREYPAKGYPWSFLVDATGMLVLHDHPQGLKDATIEPYLAATTQPPSLPASLAAAQTELDAGRWSKARDALQAAIAGGTLSKPDAGWAKGTAQWIEGRRPKVLTEAEALRAKGWHWDAWAAWDDYTRRFEGMEGCDVARTKADEVRKDPAAADDLKNGDDLVKAKDFIAQKKPSPAKLILERLSKMKSSRFAERAKELLPSAK